MIQERDFDAGMGMRDPMEEAFREGYRKGYGEAMKYVHENGFMRTAWTEAWASVRVRVVTAAKVPAWASGCTPTSLREEWDSGTSPTPMRTWRAWASAGAGIPADATCSPS